MFSFYSNVLQGLHSNVSDPAHTVTSWDQRYAYPLACFMAVVHFEEDAGEEVSLKRMDMCNISPLIINLRD